MQIDVLQLHPKLRESVQLGFLCPPVKIRMPVVDQSPHILEIGAISPRLAEDDGGHRMI